MKTRSQVLEIAAVREFDLVVIGGGIVGRRVSRKMQRAVDYRCSWSNAGDFASGTSSRTTKLIHGGLRYLEQLHFGVTRELCQGARTIRAAGTAHGARFQLYFALDEKRPFLGIKAAIGLTLYDVLAMDVPTAHRHNRISQKEVQEYVPGLAVQNITGGLRFHDCITDDSRLVTEVIKSASNEGALAINYLEVTGFVMDGDKIKGIECHDRYSGGEVTINCKTCVNASGVWSDKICQMWTSRGKNASPPLRVCTS